MLLLNLIVRLRYVYCDGGRAGTQPAFQQIFKCAEGGPYNRHTFFMNFNEDSVREHRKACS